MGLGRERKHSLDFGKWSKSRKKRGKEEKEKQQRKESSKGLCLRKGTMVFGKRPSRIGSEETENSVKIPDCTR